MKKILFTIVLCISFLSCVKNFEAEKPSVLIPKNEFEDVLFELAIVQAAKAHGKGSNSDLSIGTLTYIKNRFGYDSLTIAQNNAYYSSNAKEYEKMNNDILARLKEMQSK